MNNPKTYCGETLSSFVSVTTCNCNFCVKEVRRLGRADLYKGCRKLGSEGIVMLEMMHWLGESFWQCTLFAPPCVLTTVHTLSRDRERWDLTFQLVFGCLLHSQCPWAKRGKKSNWKSTTGHSNTHTQCSTGECGLFTLACRLLSLPFLVKMSAHPSFSLFFSASLPRWHKTHMAKRNPAPQGILQCKSFECLVGDWCLGLGGSVFVRLQQCQVWSVVTRTQKGEETTTLTQWDQSECVGSIFSASGLWMGKAKKRHYYIVRRLHRIKNGYFTDTLANL